MGEFMKVSDYFTGPEDLKNWVKNKESSEDAYSTLKQIMPEEDEEDLKETCESIYEHNDENASEVLFSVLAKYDIKNVKTSKEGFRLSKEASESRQRNGWSRGQRNKWNRTVDAYDENTPWKQTRKEFYDFTHNNPGMIKFDADPEHYYSGEALWRNYIMDKFTREYKDENGKWVGGYINDRFYVFPDAGTPSNPDVPRDGGNQMQLADGERTRKPRPHQYSTERRLEEARGNETYDLEAKTASCNAGKTTKLKKIASKSKAIEKNEIYNLFRDVVDMKEAGINNDFILKESAKHYDIHILNVAQVLKFAESMIKKHDGIIYDYKTSGYNQNFTFQVNEEVPVVTLSDSVERTLIPGTVIVVEEDNGNEMLCEIASGIDAGQKVKISTEGLNLNSVLVNVDEEDDLVQEAADETGLNEEMEMPVNQTNISKSIEENTEENTEDVNNAEDTDDAEDTFQINEV
jgi:hypothetical protein